MVVLLVYAAIHGREHVCMILSVTDLFSSLIDTGQESAVLGKIGCANTAIIVWFICHRLSWSVAVPAI